VRFHTAHRAGLAHTAQAHPNTLFLVVHDEAHWQATDANKNKYVNDPVLVNAANVVVLCVSATPYNLCTHNSRIPDAHVTTWVSADSDEPSRYYGLREYIDATNQLASDLLQQPAATFVPLKPGTIFSGKGSDRHDLFEENVERHYKALRREQKGAQVADKRSNVAGR